MPVPSRAAVAGAVLPARLGCRGERVARRSPTRGPPVQRRDDLINLSLNALLLRLGFPAEDSRRLGKRDALHQLLLQRMQALIQRLKRHADRLDELLEGGTVAELLSAPVGPARREKRPQVK